MALADADYRVSVTATMELGGAPIEQGLINVIDFYEDVSSEDSDTGFPSFVLPETMVAGDTDTRVVTATAASTGAARYTTGDIAEAEGRTVAGGAFGLINSTQLGLFVDVTITGFFEYSAYVDDGSTDYAETAFAYGFMGNVLEGIPPEGVVGAVYEPLRDILIPQSGQLQYDLVSNSFFLGFQETFSILIPPSTHDLGGGEIEIQIYDLGVFALASGVAATIGGNSGTTIMIDDIPPTPQSYVFGELERPVPEPGTVGLAIVGAGALLCRRARD